jgi:hypothetical protein
MFIRNLKRVLRGNNSALYFGVAPPSLAEYLSM